MVNTRDLLYALVIGSLLVPGGCGDGEGAEGDGVEQGRDIDPGLLEDFEAPLAQLPPIPGGYIPDSARTDQVEAVERANWHRYHSGLPPLDMIEAINLACQAHCDYYVLHIDNYKAGFSPHNENPAWSEGFTGQAPWDRMGYFGYHAGASEVIAYTNNAKLAVDGWMNTLYHRIPFMDAGLTACGYGGAGSGGWSDSSKIDTMDFGLENAQGNTYTGPDLEGIYPPPGSSGIPPSFDGLESPQPPAPPTGYPSGTIISVTWSSTANFMPIEHRIWEEESQKELPHVWLDPSGDSNLAGANTIAMYAHNPLEKGRRYWVEIKGEKNGAPWEKTWYFHTERY